MQSPDDKFQRFIAQLSAAICLVGGIPDPSFWEDKPLKELYTAIIANGINLSFTIDPDKFTNRHFS